MLSGYLPTWWRHLGRDTLKKDAWAGVTSAILVLPQGVALALLAGLPVEYGLYTAIVPVIIAALFGSSLHLISGPTTAISIVVFATISPLAEPGSADYIALVLTITLAMGLFQLALGLARLGALVNFISHTVIVGFTAGAAILIITSQMKHVFGITLPNSHDFLQTWTALIERLPQWSAATLVVAAGGLLATLIVNHWQPRWPGFLIGMVVGGIIAALLGGEERGIALVGALPASLPPLSMPSFSLEVWSEIMSGALAIAILGLMEAVSIARSIANKSHQRYDANREFVGQGLSNIIGSFFSSYASSGSFTRSGLNYSSGAKTPLAAVFSAITVAVILIIAAPLAAYIPTASVAAALLLVAYKLVDFHSIKTIFMTSRSDTAIWTTTFLATLFIELTFAVYVGVMLSMVLHLVRISHPPIISRVPDGGDEKRRFTTSDQQTGECPQLKTIRIGGSLFFGSANDVEEYLHNIERNNPEQKRVLIVCAAVNFIDVTGAELLAREAKRRRAMGGDLYLCSVKDNAYRTLRRGGYLEIIGADHIFHTKSEAVEGIFKQLDSKRCATCDKRVFQECQSIPRNGADAG